jgi:hypothetical protein
MAILHCIPPWLVTDNAQHVCKGKLNIFEAEFNQMGNIFFDLYNNYQSFNCKAPCKSLIFETLHEYSMGGKGNKTKTNMVLYFEDSVLVKTSL